MFSIAFEFKGNWVHILSPKRFQSETLSVRNVVSPKRRQSKTSSVRTRKTRRQSE